MNPIQSLYKKTTSLKASFFSFFPLFLLFFLCSFSPSVFAQEPIVEHEWAKRLGGVGSDGGSDITLNSSGNVYITGQITGNADLNGDGDFTDPYESGTGFGGTDAFISVFTSEGSNLWAKRLGGTGSDWGYGITLDFSDNVYITGQITGNADLNGDGDFIDSYESGTGFGGGDVFISVFTSEGSHLWAKRLGGVGNNEFPSGIALDSSGNVYISGKITGNADLNGDGDFTDPYESGTGFGIGDAFFSIFTSEGSHLWAKRLGGVSDDGGSGITLNSSGNVYITGQITGNADLNGDGDFTDPYESGTGFGGYDIFITVFTPEGSHLWAKRLGGVSYDRVYELTPESSRNIYVSGLVTDDVDLNGDGDFTDPYESGTGFGGYDIFITVFTSEGSHLWAKRLGGIGNDYSTSIKFNSSGNIYITGSMTGNADLNGDGDFTDPYESGTGFGDRDTFITVFTSEGSHLWAKRLGGVGGDGGSGITLNSSGNVYITGQITGNADLNGDGDFTDPYESGTGFGGTDAFISVFSFDPASPTIPLNTLSLSDNTKITGIAQDDISPLSSVEYRLSQEEDFISCQASDGAFTSKEESFSCSLPSHLPEGDYTAFIRATDSRTNTSEEVPFPFTIQFPSQIPPQNEENQNESQNESQTPPLQKDTWTLDTKDSLSFSDTNYLNKKDPTLTGKNESSKKGIVTLYTKTKKGGTKQLSTHPIDEQGKWDIDIKQKNNKEQSYALSFTNEQGISSDISPFFSLSLDSDKPRFVEPLPPTTTRDPQESISFLASDDTTEITHYQVQLYDQQGKVVRKWRKQNDPFYFLPDSLPLGIYTLHIRAYDKAGNKQESQVTIDFSKKEQKQEQENQETQQTQPSQSEKEEKEEKEEQSRNDENVNQNQNPTPPTPMTQKQQLQKESSASSSTCSKRWYNPFTWKC